MSEEEMLTLGELDAGDFDSTLEELPIFECLLMTAEPHRDADLRFLLGLLQGQASTHRRALPEQRELLMASFGRELKYDYGCATRESAQLWVV